MAKVKKRPDGRYQKTVTVGHKDGKAIRKTVYGKTQDELDRAYRTLKDEADKGISLVDSAITVPDLFRRWYENEIKGHVADKTDRSYRSTEKALRETLDTIPAKKLTAGMVEDFKGKWADRPQALFKHIQHLRGALDYGMRHDILARNVARLVPNPVPKPPRKRALTGKEKKRIKAAKLPVTERAFVSILYNTGVRRGECLALTVKDVDLKRRHLTVNKSMTGPPKTEAGYRVISFPEVMVGEVSPLITLRKKEGQPLLFPNIVGHVMSNPQFKVFWDGIKCAIFGSADKAPEDFTPHLFRHNYASELCVSGIQVKAAQYLLGHADVTTTLNIYTHFGWTDVDLKPLEEWRTKSERPTVKLQSS